MKMKDRWHLNAESTIRRLTEFLRFEFRRAGFSKGIFGLSGGVDSALVAFLAVKALGKENVLALKLPYKTSSPDSIKDAELVINRLGIRSETVDISPMVDAYLAGHPGASDLRKGNMMARQRMIVLYDLSARDGALVIGTSNKTEILLGYGTIFGDTACAVNPIGCLYKTQVWRIAEAIGVPGRIVGKPPTADLWAGQTDEGELGFLYRDVDQLLYQMVDLHTGKRELITRGYKREFIEDIMLLIKRNKFKKRPPIIAKL